MKSFFLILVIGLFSANTYAANITLDWGESYYTGGLTVSCGESSDDVQGSSYGCVDAQSTCLNRGYSPSSCSVISNCARAQDTCLNRGYSPSTCSVLGDSDAQVTCLEKGYSPSSCSSL